MTYSKEIYKQAYKIIDERRIFAQDIANKHSEEIYAKIPQVQEINRRITACAIEAARAVLKGSRAKDELERIAKVNLELQALLADVLRDNGYPLDYMEPHYTCPLCEDTAYVEKDGKTVYCQCFLELLKQCACDEINKLSPLSLSTFDTFNLEYYPYDSNADGVTPYTRMSKILNYCKNYAKNFTGKGKSLLMRGATGLGKTHLSLAIANEVLQKGYYAVYVSAPSILSKLDRLHFNHEFEEEQAITDTLCDCDLLIIDDLGTEFASSFTKSAIYNIFNNRLLQNKPMIINTNMTIRELENSYSQRFVSRIMGECDRLDFVGNDIRALKK
ncbi:MAG: ATP-binding protein [Ruminococcaceae bacterium]|nr:ATP-binding protein [Oscillospiraceae bacterium]